MRTQGGGLAHGLLDQTPPGFCPLGRGLLESQVRVPPLSTAFSVSRWREAAPPPTPCPSWALGTRHTWHVQTSARGAGSTRGAARASARRPPSKPRGGWQPSHPCPTPSQRQRILAMSKYPGSKWVDLPSTCNTTRNECRRDPRLAGPSRQQVELRHSTSPQVRPCAACTERNCVTSSASQPAQDCMCIFPKVSLNGLVSVKNKKCFLPQYKTGKVHT